MATYAIGDVHGCFETLHALLAQIGFLPSGDRLWMVGDLVNRGPDSLAVLRWAAGLDGALVAVLGNHDLHLLARAAGVAERRRRDTLDAVLAAPDRDELLAWLRARPVLHREGNRVLVHAGLFPQWSVEDAERLAREVEERLRGKACRRLLRQSSLKRAERWRGSLSAGARARVALAGMARLRALTGDGRMCADWSGPPADLPAGCLPWFAVPGRQSAGAEIVCGHWAALGLYLAPGLAALDSGCAWGHGLTALRLDDGRVFQEPTRERLGDD
jgi:bis(5'-nucleosyl)-tetraphosphatase (symmetrical)